MPDVKELGGAVGAAECSAATSVAGVDGAVDYVRGANIAGFVKVAEAMLAQGVI